MCDFFLSVYVVNKTTFLAFCVLFIALIVVKQMRPTASQYY